MSVGHPAAALRNRSFIFAELVAFLAQLNPAQPIRSEQVSSQSEQTRPWILELASGSGAHLEYFAPRLLDFDWQPSEREAALLPVLDVTLAPYANVAPAIEFDVLYGTQTHNPDQTPALAAFAINLFHIASEPVVDTFFATVAPLIANGGGILVYGPFNDNGRFTSSGNREFDQHLRQANDSWGLRDRQAIIRSASVAGFDLIKTTTMPANNVCLGFAKHPAADVI